MALALLALQIAWIFVVPPFRGSDEFDHVYKAAAVARGDWVPSPTAATRGTGAWLEVPSDLVRAAHAQCVALPYTRDVDCLGEVHRNTTRVASGSGRYHPLYYAIVGTVALPFHGYAALYAMRVASAFLCWLFFVAALWSTRAWARGIWPFVAMSVATTPVLVYSSAIVAPNGLEMLAALAFWSSAVGIVRGVPGRSSGALLVIGAVSGATLATTRSFGPLWCLLAGVTVLVAAWPGRSRIRELAADWRVWGFALVVLTSAVQSTAWIIRMSALNIGNPPSRTYPVDETLHLLVPQVPLWLLQSIAAFPLRNEPTEPVVYICYLMLFLGMLGVALVVARGTLRAAILAGCVTAVLIPFSVSVATFNEYAYVWQGRYALPYSLGLVVLAGLALDRGGRRVIDHRTRVTTLVLFVVAQVTGPVLVMRRSIAHPAPHSSGWVHPSWALVALLAVTGATTYWWSATAGDRDDGLPSARVSSNTGASQGELPTTTEWHD